MSMLTVLLTGLTLGLGSPEADVSIRAWSPADRDAQRAYESALTDLVSTDQLRALHESVCVEPHPAGSDADQRMIATLRDTMAGFGLDVELHRIWPLLSKPITAELELIEPDGTRTALPIIEAPAGDDPYASSAEAPIGWNAFAATGDVTAEVVYANYGTKADFARLRKLGVDCTGKIVIARFGGNYRGYKVKFAEEAGAVGVIIYTDPADSGYVRGAMYPDGGFANPTSIQRGSIKTLPYAGDPLTPSMPATKDAERLDADAIALPRVPVQPVGWAAAEPILQRMTGDEVPETWQGGLKFPYRLTGGPDLKVRLHVEQERAITETANVLGFIRGATSPDEKIVIGCHFDAWTWGASDPHAGTMVVLEMARVFGAMAEQGQRPDRTIVFAHWAAEEFGIIGSTEWCEANREDLLENGVAYINLDMAVTGPNFGASAAPLLKQVIADATLTVPQAGDPEGRPVRTTWAPDDQLPRFGSLGGGSDHVGFYLHLGIPSCGLRSGGAAGTCYHTNYDNLHWYRQIVGSDYEPAAMLTKISLIATARLANAPILPLDFVRYAADTRGHLDGLKDRASKQSLPFPDTDLREAIDAFEREAKTARQRLDRAIETGRVDPATRPEINTILRRMERNWLTDAGLPGRPWYRSRYAASDPDSGYAAWMLPAVRQAIQDGATAEIGAALDSCTDVFRALTRDVVAIDRMLPR